MKHRINTFIVFAIIISLCLPIASHAHSGRTDGNGGHMNHSTGEYHYHHGYGAHDHYDVDNDGDIDCPYDFKDASKSSPASVQSSNAQSENSVAAYSRGKKAGYDDGYKQGKEDANANIQEKLKERTYSAVGVTLLLNYFVLQPVITIFSESANVSKSKAKTIKPESKPLPSNTKIYNSNSGEGSAKVTSSFISEVSYKDGVLTITMKNGKYSYYGVPYHVYKEMISAPSVGKYYYDNIKWNYPTR